jgi:hypothetical protein
VSCDNEDVFIPAGSPFRRLPENMDRKQALFLDAIRLTIEMAEVAFTRVSEALLRLTASPNTPPTPLELAAVFSDAWATIDAGHRLSGLMSQFPGLKHGNRWPSLRAFQNEAKRAEDLRHYIQHLDQDLRGLVSLEKPAWGTLTWLAPDSPGSKILRSGLLMPGTIYSGSREMINPSRKLLQFPICAVSLAAGKYSCCLSDLVKSIERLTGDLEAALLNSFDLRCDLLPSLGTDALVVVTLRSVGESEQRSEVTPAG